MIPLVPPPTSIRSFPHEFCSVMPTISFSEFDAEHEDFKELVARHSFSNVSSCDVNCRCKKQRVTMRRMAFVTSPAQVGSVRWNAST